MTDFQMPAPVLQYSDTSTCTDAGTGRGGSARWGEKEAPGMLRLEVVSRNLSYETGRRLTPT